MSNSWISCMNFSSVRLCVDKMDVEICERYAYERWCWDFYATSIGASLIVFLGVLGNAGTLYTLSGVRLSTATFVYYRGIASVDLVRCVFVFTYVLRVLIPFRRYYWTSWYEAHLMYFVIATLGFISTTLAVFLCFRLCYCIAQSRRMKKLHTSANKTKRIIYSVAAISLAVNVWLCFERQVQLALGDECSFAPEGVRINDSVTVRTPKWYGGGKKYALAPSEFSRSYLSWLKVVHNLPAVLLLILFVSTLFLLLLCIISFSSAKHKDILSNQDSSTGNSKTLRTQRHLCRLFLTLSICYAFGLLPSLIYETFFTDSSIGQQSSSYNNATNSSIVARDESRRSYENILSVITRRQISAIILNVLQNFSHAVSFYIYLLCSKEFRNEFLNKLSRVRGNLQEAYSSVAVSRFSVKHSRRSSPTSPLIAVYSTPGTTTGRYRSIPFKGDQRFGEYSNRKTTNSRAQSVQLSRKGSQAATEPLLSPRSPTVEPGSQTATVELAGELKSRHQNRRIGTLIRRMSMELTMYFHKRGSVVGVIERASEGRGNEKETVLS